MTRPRGDHAVRRDEVALAAADLIATQGLERLTLRDIAQRLGVTTGVLTHYFASKEALLRHTKDHAFKRSFARARAAAEHEQGVDSLHAVVEGMLPIDRERRTLWRLLVAFYGSAVGSASLRRAQDRRMRRWFALFRDLISELRRTKVLSADVEPERAGMAIALLVQGMAIHFVMTAPETPAEWQIAFAREQVERLIRART